MTSGLIYNFDNFVSWVLILVMTSDLIIFTFLQVELRFVDSKIYSLYIIIFEQGKMRYILITEKSIQRKVCPKEATKFTYTTSEK
jgi:hypothetical protein